MQRIKTQTEGKEGNKGYCCDNGWEVEEQGNENVISLEPREHQFETVAQTTDPLAVAHNNIPIIQSKLIVGQSNDPYEQEADRMADLAVRHLSNRQLQLGRGKEKPQIRFKKGNSFKSPIVPESIALRLSQKKGQGNRLPTKLQAQMERSFGVDFSQVRIHTDREAVQMNQQLGARAFTYGSDIYFNQGEYQLASIEGHRLLAHELTHTVQQSISSRFITADVEENALSSIGAKSENLSLNSLSGNIDQKLQMKSMTGTEAYEEIARDRIYEILGHEYAYKDYISFKDRVRIDSLGYIPYGPYKGAYDFQMWLFKPNSIGKKSGGETVLAFRGTSSLQDLAEDFQQSGVGFRQFIKNLDMIQRHLEGINTPVTVCGHSLGGALAQLTAAVFPQYISKVITFQSPGIPKGFVKALIYNTEGEKGKLVHGRHYRAGDDIVDDVGEAFIPGITYEIFTDKLPGKSPSSSGGVRRAVSAHRSSPLHDLTSTSKKNRRLIAIKKLNIGKPEVSQQLESLRRAFSMFGDGIWGNLSEIDNELRTWIFNNSNLIPKLEASHNLMFIETLLWGIVTMDDRKAVDIVINSVPKDQIPELVARLEAIKETPFIVIAQVQSVITALRKRNRSLQNRE